MRSNQRGHAHFHLGIGLRLGRKTSGPETDLCQPAIYIPGWYHLIEDNRLKRTAVGIILSAGEASTASVSFFDAFAVQDRALDMVAT